MYITAQSMASSTLIATVNSHANSVNMAATAAAAVGSCNMGDDYSLSDLKIPKEEKLLSMCFGCGAPIADQYLLQVAPDLAWHIACLKCSECGMHMDETCTCFVRAGKTYCKLDYIRLFSKRCAKCHEPFAKNDLVIRTHPVSSLPSSSSSSPHANTGHIYHLDCFCCAACNKQLNAGDEYAIRPALPADIHHHHHQTSSSAANNHVVLCKQDNDIYDQRLLHHQQQQQQQHHMLATNTCQNITNVQQQHYHNHLQQQQQHLQNHQLNLHLTANNQIQNQNQHLHASQPHLHHLHNHQQHQQHLLPMHGKSTPISGIDLQENPVVSCLSPISFQQQQQQQQQASSGEQREAAAISLSSSSLSSASSASSINNSVVNATRHQLTQLTSVGSSSVGSSAGGSSSNSSSTASPNNTLLAGPQTASAAAPPQASQPIQQQQHANPATNANTNGNHHHHHHHHHHRKDKTTRVRTVLNEKQLHTLRTCYGANPRPDALMKEQLVEMTGLSPRVIRVWFQNKRCKDKKKTILIKQMQEQQKNRSSIGHGMSMVASSPTRNDMSCLGPGSQVDMQSSVAAYQTSSLAWSKAISDFANGGGVSDMHAGGQAGGMMGGPGGNSSGSYDQLMGASFANSDDEDAFDDMSEHGRGAGRRRRRGGAGGVGSNGAGTGNGVMMCGDEDDDDDDDDEDTNSSVGYDDAHIQQL